jgi:hypothetical protein
VLNLIELRLEILNTAPDVPPILVPTYKWLPSEEKAREAKT